MALINALTAIADAIRGKTGKTDALTLPQMAEEIAGLELGSEPVLTELSITENGEYTPDEGVDGFSKVTVEVESAAGYYTEEVIIKWLGRNSASTHLTSFVIPDGCRSVGAFSFANCSYLTDITIPDSVTYLGQNAFSSCPLNIAKLPEGVTEIGSSAFNSCKLQNFYKLPDALQTIGQAAFQYVTAFGTDAMKIPAGVTSIGKQAFQNSPLTEITFEGTPASIAADSFKITDLATINVPWAEGAVANAPWGATNATINYNYVEG